MTNFIDKLERTTKPQVIFFIILVGFVVYLNSLFNGFVWDDEEEIINNQIVHSLRNVSQIVSGGTFNTGGTGALSGWFFRPVRTLTIMVNYAIWGPNAFGWHLVQVIFHLVNTVLVFLILDKLLESKKYRNMIAGLLSLIFVVHPGINEAIVYIAAASETLYSFCGLLTIYLFLKTGGNRPGWKNLIASALLLMAGLLVKESAIVVFPLMILYLLLYRTKFWSQWLVVLIGTPIFYLLIRLFLIKTPFRPLSLSIVGESSLIERLLTVPYIIISYLRLSFYPRYLAISQQEMVRDPSFGEFFLPLVVVIVFFLVLILLGIRYRAKMFFLGLAWFTIGLIPILNIFPLDMTIAERWLYFPLVGLVIVFADLLSVFLAANKRRVMMAIFFAVILLSLLSIRTIIRNTDWHDGLTLYGNDLKINPNSFDIQNNYGVELFRKGRIKEAKPHFEKSIELNPKWHFAINNLGAVYQNEGDLLKAKELYQKVVDGTSYYLAYENLAMTMLKIDSPTETLRFLEKAVLKLPLNARLRTVQALAHWKNNDYFSAEAAARLAYSLEPSQQNAIILQAVKSKQKPDF